MSVVVFSRRRGWGRGRRGRGADRVGPRTRLSSSPVAQDDTPGLQDSHPGTPRTRITRFASGCGDRRPSDVVGEPEGAVGSGPAAPLWVTFV